MRMITNVTINHTKKIKQNSPNNHALEGFNRRDLNSDCYDYSCKKEPEKKNVFSSYSKYIKRKDIYRKADVFLKRYGTKNICKFLKKQGFNEKETERYLTSKINEIEGFQELDKRNTAKIQSDSIALRNFYCCLTYPRIQELNRCTLFDMTDILRLTALDEKSFNNFIDLIDNQNLFKFLSETNYPNALETVESIAKQDKDRQKNAHLIINDGYFYDAFEKNNIPFEEFKNLTQLRSDTLDNYRNLLEAMYERLLNKDTSYEDILKLSILPPKIVDEFIKKIKTINVSSDDIELFINFLKHSEKKTAFEVLRLYDKSSLKHLNFSNLPEYAVINDKVADDINKLYIAQSQGKKPIDIFIPGFDSIEEAEEKTSTGESCQINGELYIKDKNLQLEKMDISPKSYLKLFEPIRRFAITQHNIGDCYLVSSLSAMFENPSTRSVIVSCFKENPNGSITAQFPEGEETLTLKENESVEDISSDYYFSIKRGRKEKIKGGYYISTGSLGLQMLEYLYGKEIVRALYDKKFYGTSTSNQTRILLSTDKRVKKYIEKRIEDPKDIDRYSETARGNGGLPYAVLKMFGIILAPEKLKNMKLSDIEYTLAYCNPEREIAIGCTKPKLYPNFINNELNIEKNHAYRVELNPKDNCQTTYRLFNPHNTLGYISVTSKELKDFFDYVYIQV